MASDDDDCQGPVSLAVVMGLHGTVDELVDYAPSDGLVVGLGHVNGCKFDESRSRCVVLGG